MNPGGVTTRGPVRRGWSIADRGAEGQRGREAERPELVAFTQGRTLKDRPAVRPPLPVHHGQPDSTAKRRMDQARPKEVL